jgi:biotin transporter BioY
VVGALRPAGGSWISVVASLAAGEALIHLLGVLYLAAVQNLGARDAFVLGSLPFLPVAVAKIGFVATLLVHYGRFLARRFDSADDVD